MSQSSSVRAGFTGWFLLIVAIAAITACSVAQAATVYVDSRASTCGDGQNWTTAYKYLQDALTAARNSGGAITEIRVGTGTYQPDRSCANPAGSRSRSATFQLINNVALRGGYAGIGLPDPNARDISANETILSGDLAGDDVLTINPLDLTSEPTRAENSSHVVTGSETNATAALEGFTVTGGNANVGSSPTYYGGGMYNSAGSPTVTQCKFSGNSTQYYGGGVYNDNSSSPTLTSCTFYRNSARNYGGGVYNKSSSSPTLINCTFNGNAAGVYAGGMYNYSSCNPTLVNCVFLSNVASNYGGGINNNLGNPMLINCTFGGNSAGYNGGAIRNSSGNLTLANCIIWGNSDSQIYGTVTATYSCIQGGLAGTGNISADPMLACEANGYVGLRIGSPCIDAGNNTALPAGVLTDVLGFARFIDDPAASDTGSGTSPIVDMGAKELDPAGDDDGDGLLNGVDNCPVTANFDQNDSDADGVGDGCDNCRTQANPEQNDADWDGIGDACDTCPHDLLNDEDHDGVCGDVDNCLQTANPDQVDADYDGIGDACDTCPNDPLNDKDHDGVCGDVDNCPVLANSDQQDTNGDGIGDVCSSILFVDGRASAGGNGRSWSTAYKTLQDAMAFAAGGTVMEIRVAVGTYKPDRGGGNSAGDPGAMFRLIPGVALRGGYAGIGAPDPNNRDVAAYPTILSGDLAGNDVPVADPLDLVTQTERSENSTHVVFSSGVTASAVMDGFTITGGRGLYGGGGMYNDKGSPTVANCIFLENTVPFSIGGAGMRNVYSSPTLTACTFKRNALGASGCGAGMYNVHGSPVLTNCAFIENRSADYSRGAGMYIAGEGSPVLKGCTFVGNVGRECGGAIYCSDISDLTATDCIFVGNSAAFGGGAYALRCNPVFANCIFVGNSALPSICCTGKGGVFYAYSCDNLRVVNCTFTQNAATSSGSVFYSSNNAPSVVNCLIWDNGSNVIYDNLTTTEITYSCVQGGYAGVGNITSPPQFMRNPSVGGDGVWGTADDDWGDLRLQPSSPCIDAGDNVVVPAGITTDLAGALRFIDVPATPDTGNPGDPPTAVVDMGAYEHDPMNDYDGDGITNGIDNCPVIANSDQADMDHDDIGDICDDDLDGDDVTNATDICPNVANPGQEDGDGDHVGDVCDNCPAIANSDQADMDHDAIGDVCDGDRDGDAMPNASDNCPSVVNPGQEDADGDHVGDVCDACPDTPPGFFVDAQGCRIHNRADFDDDGDVDQEDFGHLQVCLTVGSNPSIDPICENARLAGNLFINEQDVSIFMGCLSGPNVPADPACVP